MRPGPQAMMPSAIAAQVRWIGQPSGTVSSTIAVMNSNPSTAKRVPSPSPSTSRTGNTISPHPERKAITVGAGKWYGPPGRCSINSSVNNVRAVSLSFRNPFHLRMPERQNGTEIARDGAGTAQKWTRGADRQREWRDRNPSNTQIERQRSARRCRQPLLIVGYQPGDRGRSPPGHDKRSRRAGSAFSAANRA
jgi:hypothetical protein